MHADADASNKDGRTALMWACKSGRARAVSLLLDEAHADASLRMKDDSTAFDWAAPRPVEKAVGGAARAPVRLTCAPVHACTRAPVYSCTRPNTS